MKKFRLVLLVSIVVSLCLEIFTKGAVCNFATPEKTITETFSYFSLVPYGYANFGPFLTSILTCVLLMLAIILFTPKAKKVLTAAKAVSAISVATSLFPLIMLGADYFNLISYLISVLMIVQLFAIIKIKKEVLANETQ